MPVAYTVLDTGGNLLFEIEREIADKEAEERYEVRPKQVKPVLDAMFAWENTRTAAPRSAFAG